MLYIFSMPWRIALLNSGHEELPSSRLLLLVVYLASVLFSLAESLRLGTPPLDIEITINLTQNSPQTLSIYGFL